MQRRSLLKSITMLFAGVGLGVAKKPEPEPVAPAEPEPKQDGIYGPATERLLTEINDAIGRWQLACGSTGTVNTFRSFVDTTHETMEADEKGHIVPTHRPGRKAKVVIELRDTSDAEELARSKYRHLECEGVLMYARVEKGYLYNAVIPMNEATEISNA